METTEFATQWFFVCWGRKEGVSLLNNKHKQTVDD